jgi:predicted RNase H-like nuclease (RuvC/YqgF family)
MAAGTKERRATVADQIDIVREEVERAARLTGVARELARRMAAGHIPTSHERQLFKLVSWDQSEIDREVGRWGAVARWQKKAGTAESRESDANELEAAKQAEKKDGAALDQQIADLQRQRAAMRERVTSAESRQAMVEQAIGALRDLSSNRQEVAIQRRAVDERYRDLPTLESELNMIRSLRGLDEQGRLSHAQAVRREGVKLIDIHNGGGMNVEVVNLVRWSQYVSEREADAIEIEQRANELRSLRDAEMTSINTLLDELIPE